MAVKWSWAWGAETAATLETDAGWDFSSTSASNATSYPTGGLPAGVPEFTYTGSPTRYTINLKSSSTARSPLNIGAPQGWICGHFYLNSAGGFSNYQALTVLATSNGRATYVVANGPDTLKLYYDMSGATWSGQLYMNGVAVTAAYTDPGVAQTSSYFRISGLLNSSLITGGYWGGASPLRRSSRCWRTKSIRYKGITHSRHI